MTFTVVFLGGGVFAVALLIGAKAFLTTRRGDYDDMRGEADYFNTDDWRQ